MTYTNRAAVREIERKIRYNHYDKLRIRELLDKLPTYQEGKLLYEAMLIGLDLFEREYGIRTEREVAKEGLEIETHRITDERVGATYTGNWAAIRCRP